MVTNLFNCIFDHVARNMYIFLLSKSNCARDGLTLYGRIPLQLDNEDATGASDIQPINWSALYIPRPVVIELFNIPKTTSSSCHDQYWLLNIILKLFEPIFSFFERAGAIDVKIWNLSLAKISAKKLQRPSPT